MALFRAVAARAGVKQVFVNRRQLGVLRLGLKMLYIEFAGQSSPLLSIQAENATKAELIAQPGLVGTSASVTLWAVPTIEC